jgi:hypothetical protein
MKATEENGLKCSQNERSASPIDYDPIVNAVFLAVAALDVEATQAQKLDGIIRAGRIAEIYSKGWGTWIADRALSFHQNN